MFGNKIFIIFYLRQILMHLLPIALHYYFSIKFQIFLHKPLELYLNLWNHQHFIALRSDKNNQMVPQSKIHNLKSFDNFSFAILDIFHDSKIVQNNHFQQLYQLLILDRPLQLLRSVLQDLKLHKNGLKAQLKLFTNVHL